MGGQQITNVQSTFSVATCSLDGSPNMMWEIFFSPQISLNKSQCTHVNPPGFEMNDNSTFCVVVENKKESFFILRIY